jgi:phosphoribosylformylglycinamidine cyclo-ligase
VFNMGHRFELYLPEKFAEEVKLISQTFGVEAEIIGRVESFKGKKVTIKSEFGEFIYQ